MMGNNHFPGPTPEGQFPGPLPRDPYPSRQPAGAFSEHEWMPWAVAELSAEIDAVTALLAVRRYLDREPADGQPMEAQILRRAIDQLVGRTDRIDWSLLVRLLASFERYLQDRPEPDRANREHLMATLRIARAASAKARQR
jgi:hypothetical protein